MAIRSLCITESADRPTVATFIGMHKAGVELTVVCPADHPNNKILVDAGVGTVDIRLPKNFDKHGIAALRTELVRGHYHIMHTFNNKAVSNGLRACKGLPIKVICYRDPLLRRRMGAAARERIATDFRNEDTVKKTIALYEELIPNPDS